MKRLFVLISLGILISMIISMFAIGQIMRARFGEKFEQERMGWFENHIEFVQRHLSRFPPEEIDREIHQLRGIIREPLDLYDTNDPIIPPEVARRLETAPIVILNAENGPQAYFRLRNNDKIVRMGPHRGPPKQFSVTNLALIAGVMIPIVGITALILTFPLVRRLRILEKAAVRIREGDLSARIPVASNDAVGQVAQQFNRMADRIQRLLESQQHLLRAVSHELRTPIARIDFILEMLASAKTPEEKERRIDEVREELDELNQLVGELLLYARFDKGTVPLTTQRLSLYDTLLEIEKRLQNDRPEIKLEIREPGEEIPDIHVHPVYFRRAIQNLVSNAIRHAHSSVVVDFGYTEDGIFVDVMDDGPGIPTEDRETIFEPFSRLDRSRSRKSGGVGLGLSIVKRIVESHDGSILVTDGKQGGTQFLTLWPLQTPS